MMTKGKDGFWTVLEAVRVIHNNKLVFLFIALFTTLPLSFLFFTLSITTHTLRSHIYHLEALALFTSTLMEARHVWHESRDNAVYLLRIRALFLLICLPLSLAAAVSSVHTTYNFIQGKSVTVNSAVNAVKENWKRPLVTAVFVYVILFVFSPVPRVIASGFSSPELRFMIMAIGLGFEVYLMAVMSLGMVVSVVEDRTGLEAITVGSGLMRGKRLIFGWLLSGLFVLVSGFMNGRVEVLLEGPSPNSEISVWDKTVLICSYGFIVLFSYVVTTVFYCHSRIRHSVREQPQTQDHDDCVSLSSSL